MNKLVRSFFYSNYFYGCCVVALSIEANLQQGFTLNHPLYYLFLFSATVVYYTQAYTSETSFVNHNKRSIWYIQNKKKVAYSQWILITIALVSGLTLFQKNVGSIIRLSIEEWSLILIFPLTATLYYGSISPKNITHNLRNIGWLKPFVIGFVWTGAVTIYPVLFRAIEMEQHFSISILVIWFFIKNLFFISLLCILFDIKDYAADHNNQLQTFVVKLGLRKTLFYLILPLALLGFSSFIVFTFSRNFPVPRILVNSIPFILLLIVTWTMQRRKSILYYLAIIDGLMLVKAACGIIGMLLIK